MKQHFAVIAFLAAGCGQEPAFPAQALASDAMLRTLPAGTTLVGGVSPAAFLDHEAWLQLALPNPDPLRLALAERTGLNDLGAAEQVRLGCGASGCVVLASGDFADLKPARLVHTAPRELRVRSTSRGLDLRTQDGAFVVRRLGPHKLVAGDRSAVVQIAREQHRERVHGSAEHTDLEPLADLVPPDDLWLAAHTPHELVQHMSQRLQRSRNASAHRLAADLEDMVTQQGARLDAVEAVAASITAGTTADVEVRVRCATEVQARELTTLAAARLLLLPSSLPSSVRHTAAVARHGRIVQLTAELDWNELQEVQP